jgi:arabinofuranosyltransferase
VQLLNRVLLLTGVFAYGVVLYRTAWLSDDAFITLRTIDNFVHGYGLRWNVLERVQTYTHPLWMLLLLGVYSVTREAFHTTLAVSVTLSMATCLWVAHVARRSNGSGAVLVLGLALSRCYVDYSTSGLENPLSHLLTVAFYVFVVSHRQERSAGTRLAWGAFLTGLCVVNREDTLLLFLPTLILGVFREGVPRKDVLRAFVGGAVAPLLWTAFSVIYYGFPFPNTAYAKLNVQIPRSALALRGLQYVFDFLTHDPLSAAFVVTLLALIVRRGSARDRAWGFGIVLYLAYVVVIGGDFMSGRFFSMPVLMSALWLIENVPTWKPLTSISVALAMIGLMLCPRHPLWSPPDAKLEAINVWQGTGIVDERLYYFPTASLVYDHPTHSIRPWHERALEGLELRLAGHRVVERAAVGYIGYFAGPEVHIIDTWALCDPLLSRIPYRANKGKFRMGHFQRKRPLGYERAVLGDASAVQQPLLARVYRDVQLASRGRLFTRERWAAILRLNFGAYTKALKLVRY